QRRGPCHPCGNRRCSVWPVVPVVMNPVRTSGLVDRDERRGQHPGMSEHTEVYPVPSEWAQRARMNAAGYEAARIAARETPEAFWREQARRLDWVTAPTKIKDVSFDQADFRIRWFEDGVLNVAWDCLDRHLETRGDETAIIWEGDEPDQSGRLSYRELHVEVCRMANVLKTLGGGRGDRVTIYLPMIPAAAAA